jgi:proteasome lid subunit RPN8/RPN11
MIASPARLVLSTELLGQVLTHARESQPREAVGLLGGRPTGQVELALPLANIAPGERRFIADPYSQYRALQRIEAGNLHVLAIYHSHPGGGVYPSVEDLAYARRWSCAHLVIALAESSAGGDRLRAFRFDDRGETEKVAIEVVARLLRRRREPANQGTPPRP